MRFASIGSGSKGNGTLVVSDDTCLLVDCGFTLKETELRLLRRGCRPEDIDAILVTHEHGDHANGVGPLARRYQIPVYLTPGTLRQARLGDLPSAELIDIHQSFHIKSIEVTPVAVPHDAREPCQFVFSSGEKRLGILTDLGSITPFVKQQSSGLDALVLECNHDANMLAEGPYPPSLKARVGGAYGHLSNRQAAELLADTLCDALQHLVLSHLSEQNNTPEQAVAAISQALGCDRNWLTVADQALGFDWHLIS